MTYYGIVLTLYNSTSQQTDQVKNLLTTRQFPFELIENTFFVGIPSVKKSRDFENELATLPLTYSYIWLFDSDGSKFLSLGIDQPVSDDIKRIFFENS